MYGELAQMGERRPCKAEVKGSNPVFSIRDIKKLHPLLLPALHIRSLIGIYATSGCCVTGTDSRTGEMQDYQTARVYEYDGDTRR